MPHRKIFCLIYIVGSFSILKDGKDFSTSMAPKISRSVLPKNKKSPRGINPAIVLAPLVPSMAGTSTYVDCTIKCN